MKIISGEADTKRIVRPYTTPEASVVGFEAGEPGEYKVARLAITKLIDEARFTESATTSSEGERLARSGHFERISKAQDTFVRYFVDAAGADYEGVMSEARERHEAIKRENEARTKIDQIELELSA